VSQLSPLLKKAWTRSPFALNKDGKPNSKEKVIARDKCALFERYTSGSRIGSIISRRADTLLLFTLDLLELEPENENDELNWAERRRTNKGFSPDFEEHGCRPSSFSSSSFSPFFFFFLSLFSFLWPLLFLPPTHPPSALRR
jgi:hypothetical protein